MAETDYSDLVRRARLGQGVTGVSPLQRYGGELLAEELKDMFAPTPLNVALMALGPAGRIAGRVGKAAVLGLGGLLESGSEAQAGPASRLARSVLNTAKRIGAEVPNVPPLAGAERMPGIVSTRYPTAVGRSEDPLAAYLQPNMAALRADPENYRRVMQIMAGYPGMPRNLASAPPAEIEQIISEFMRGNLRSLYETQPDVVRKLGSRWYEGANRIATNRADIYGLPPNSTAAVYASLSPQKDWFMNVGLGDRVLDIMANQQRKTFDANMAQRAREFLDRSDIAALKGRQLRSLEPDDQARFVRAFDETYNPRSYQIVAPTGEMLGPKLTKGGEPSNIAWGTFDQIENAIRAIQSGGDVNTISADILGTRHKVRSFYNNILYPDAPLGDVTSDTHNVAASLFRPLSGHSPEVIHSLASSGPAGSINMPKSAVTGTQGSYPMFGEAMRDVAPSTGGLPRATQSVTWEGIRNLFSPEFKRSPQAAQIEAIWRKYGIEKAPAAREEIVNLLGGYRLPDWAVIGGYSPR